MDRLRAGWVWKVSLFGFQEWGGEEATSCAAGSIPGPRAAVSHGRGWASPSCIAAVISTRESGVTRTKYDPGQEPGQVLGELAGEQVALGTAPRLHLPGAAPRGTHPAPAPELFTSWCHASEALLAQCTCRCGLFKPDLFPSTPNGSQAF